LHKQQQAEANPTLAANFDSNADPDDFCTDPDRTLLNLKLFLFLQH
jgi:hypothetical protein